MVSRILGIFTPLTLDSVLGVIHQISHPLIPPPPVFQETFFVPEVFSFFVRTLSVRDRGLGC